METQNMYTCLSVTPTGELLRHPGGTAGHPHATGDAEGATGVRQVERRGNRWTKSAGSHNKHLPPQFQRSSCYFEA